MTKEEIINLIGDEETLFKLIETNYYDLKIFLPNPIVVDKLMNEKLIFKEDGWFNATSKLKKLFRTKT